MAVAVAGVFFSAPAASAATLPSTNTAHHTTEVCGWTHHKTPADKYETAKCKDASL
ncbi:hypothetical protein ABZ619_41145 [Streptomyces sp. NPDC007851]|uniref:hypothetical protein n=1 Tax=Streptomyces sp. NPDC007851 TaxID=3155008 RepID=UPI0033DC418E